MKTNARAEFLTHDEYISSQPVQVREGLEQIRQIVKKVAPDAEEVISYQMPAFKFHGILLYYASFKNHFSIFPKTDVIVAFKEKLKGYAVTKGTIHFPFGKPLPTDLITEIVKFRVKENLDKMQMKELSKHKQPKK
jgi:uncharacterized protein YdhG (YjbR/CyaY superfamily)